LPAPLTDVKPQPKAPLHRPLCPRLAHYLRLPLPLSRSLPVPPPLSQNRPVPLQRLRRHLPPTATVSVKPHRPKPAHPRASRRRARLLPLSRKRARLLPLSRNRPVPPPLSQNRPVPLQRLRHHLPPTAIVSVKPHRPKPAHPRASRRRALPRPNHQLPRQFRLPWHLQNPPLALQRPRHHQPPTATVFVRPHRPKPAHPRASRRRARLLPLSRNRPAPPPLSQNRPVPPLLSQNRPVPLQRLRLHQLPTDIRM